MSLQNNQKSQQLGQVALSQEIPTQNMKEVSM